MDMHNWHFIFNQISLSNLPQYILIKCIMEMPVAIMNDIYIYRYKRTYGQYDWSLTEANTLVGRTTTPT